MPRKGKYIPSGFSERNKIAKKNLKRTLAVVPLYTGVPIQNKFCFAGDVTLNLRWLQTEQQQQQQNYVESYDIPFKGLISMEFRKDSGIVESRYYSKCQQLDDKEGKISYITKIISSVSDIKALQFAEFISTITSKAEQQKTIGRALVRQNIRLDSLYEQAHKKAMEIIASYDVGEANIHYSIQQYNFDLQQLEKSYNGMNLKMIIGGGFNLMKIEDVKGKLGSFIKDYLYLGYLVDPFNLNDDIRETMIHTADGITLKVIIHQKTYQILPCYFYLLKMRLIYFDREDIRKLNIFRQTGELLYPLQLTDLEVSGKDGYFDYSPNYNFNPLVSTSNLNNNNDISNQQPQASNSDQDYPICEQEEISKPVSVIASPCPQYTSNIQINQYLREESGDASYLLGQEPFSQFLQPFQNSQYFGQSEFKDINNFEMSNISQMIEQSQKEQRGLVPSFFSEPQQANQHPQERSQFSDQSLPENLNQDSNFMINHSSNSLQSGSFDSDLNIEENRKKFLSKFYQIDS